MLQSAIPLCFVLLTVSADIINSFHKVPSTKKPDMFIENGPASKPKKSSHISEFTDPDTGLNPFLDLEEGPTSAGRNVMKDERREDPPFLDFELVEGDSSDRRWASPDISKLPVEETIHRWPPFEDSIKEIQTTEKNLPEILTTEKIRDILIVPEMAVKFNESLQEGKEDVRTISKMPKVKEGVMTSKPYKSSMLYCAATIVAVATLALVVGVCWWRRKVKRTTHSPVAVENGELER